MLTKLIHYGIRGIALQWFESYLKNRDQYVESDQSVNLKYFEITREVPQSCVLELTLFLVYLYQ